MSVDYSAGAVLARLRQVADATDLRTENRLRSKIDYSPQAVLGRLREVERARRACVALGTAQRVPDPE